MRIELKQVLFPQPKSKIKAGDGKAEGKYKFFTSSPIQSKFVDEANYDKPSLIFGTGGNASVHFCNEPFSTSTDCLVMYGRNKTELETIYNYLKSNIGVLENGFKGAGLKHISKDYILAIEIDLPSEEIQLDFLQKNRIIDGLIEAKQVQLHLSAELVKSRFIELMDSAELSEETTIEQITERVKVGFVGTCEKYYTDDSGIPMLRTGNITDHGIDMSDLKYVTAEFHEKNKKSQIRRGDLLIARHGSNGQANVYDGPEAQCLNAVVIVPNSAIAKSVFLAGLINSPNVKEQIDRTLVGSTQHVVNTKSIANLVVRIPQLIVQEHYEAFVEQTDKSKLEIQKSLEKLETLKKALMQKYFG